MVSFILGIIDCTDFEIKQPLRGLAAFTNRKKKTSVKLQAVCDANMMFLDISCAWPGSMHDSRIYGLSSLSQVIEERLEGTDLRILGDSGYQLSNRMMTPYRNNGNFTAVR